MFYEILWVSIIGGMLNLDSRVVGQMMFSRPFIAGTIVGLILGEVKTGILIGVLVELLWISVISMGGAVPWNTCVIGVVATGLVILINDLSGEMVILAIVFAVPCGWLFKILDVWWRYKNASFTQWVERWIEKDKLNKILLLNWWVVLIVFIGSFLFYLFAFFITTWIISSILKIMTFSLRKGLRFAYELLPFLGFAIAWNTFALKSMVKTQKYKDNLPVR